MAHVGSYGFVDFNHVVNSRGDSSTGGTSSGSSSDEKDVKLLNTKIPPLMPESNNLQLVQQRLAQLDRKTPPLMKAINPSTSSDTADLPKRLHVSNIPFRWRDGDLLREFSKFGPVTEVEIIFNERGSKGFGFVAMERAEDAEKAMVEMTGKIVDGRAMEVNKATARVHSKKMRPPVAATTIPHPMQQAINPYAAIQNPLAIAQLQNLNTQLMMQNPFLLQNQQQPLVYPIQYGNMGLDQAAELQLALLAGEQQRQMMLANAIAAQGAAAQNPVLASQQYLANALQMAAFPVGIHPQQYAPKQPPNRAQITRFSPY